MKVKSTAIEEFLSPLRPYFQKDNFTREDVDEKPPLRSELFSADQMDYHARQLAETHHLSHEQAPEQLLRRLAENEEIIIRVTNLLQETVSAKKAITPAGEWLLDNFYLIEEQIQTGKRYLPKGYSKGLPKLKNGLLAGYPRVYDIAIEIISHSDGHVDVHSLSGFIAAYQKVSHLTIGELWAIPIMLRLALLENLRRVAARIAVDRIDAAHANLWASRIMEIAQNDPKELVLVIADMARSKPPMVSAFVAEFARKLQWRGLDLKLPLTWMEQHLSGSGHTINSMVLAENQQQAADQLSVSNSINSLRFLSKMDWREFVESISVVEQTLRRDPVYPKMDFLTRDNYRHVVEKIAKRSTLSENEVAQHAIDLASKADNTDNRKTHVGYYLIDEGVLETEKLANMQLPLSESVRKLIIRSRYKFYVIASLVICFGVTAGFLTLAQFSGLPGWMMFIIGLLSLLTGSQLAVSLVNWFSTIWVSPKPLPKMDFSLGIPSEARTLVVIPTLITHPKQVDKLLHDLEVRFLANRDNNLLFALLTDFTDAFTEKTPQDEPLLQHLVQHIQELNNKYGYTKNEMFYLFHRPRKYNAAERAWMGYERKRGKLGELNQLILGGEGAGFSVIVGEDRMYPTIKFVITLDTDTQLPRDAAWKLTGLIAHPLNRAFYDERKKRVTKGYGIIQPRIAISLHGAVRSPYSKLNENDAGIDPYTRVVSDVYQDVFEEGSFIGKGIYEVKIFEEVLADRFPENRILSHDLLEGSYVRCGYASDVQLYEEYPSTYQADIARRHRWIRGDWQIATWLLPLVPQGNGKLGRNPVSALSRWKIFDNLRRSLIPIAFVLFLLLGWTVLSSPWIWTLSLLGIIFIPSLMSSLWATIRKPKEIDFTQHFNNTIVSTNKNLLSVIFAVACLPYEALVSFDGILRTFWRVYISKSRLLEWNPSSLRRDDRSLTGSYLKMFWSPLFAIVSFAAILQYHSLSLYWAVPFLLLWFFAPLFVWYMSRPYPAYQTKLDDAQRTYLRELSRKTWAFFETLVNEEENWLPPDNLQLYPIPVIAHRTSPTNIGLSLLANLAANDFGYSTVGELINRCENTISTLKKLERFKGHFYNWYDTRTLATLQPRYISTVDSGNLSGHLLTLRQGLFQITSEKIVGTKIFDGLRDTLQVLLRLATEDKQESLKEFQVYFNEQIPSQPYSLSSVARSLKNISAAYHKFFQPESESKSEQGWWMHALPKQLIAIIEEIELLAPWAFIPILEKFNGWMEVHEVPSLVSILNYEEDQDKHPEKYEGLTVEEKQWLQQYKEARAAGLKHAKERVTQLHDIAAACFFLADAEYNFLYDKSQRLLAIGFSVDENRRDNSYYDLLASEARLSVFVAIAQGKLPQESWFALGRRLTTTGDSFALLSWSGSMFEYLMPVLVMPSYENTLLHETGKGTVKKQIEYGRQQNVPWGVSESCYNLVDGNLTYQYRAFGVPSLGFKRGLGQDLVIAPYATVLALMVDPESSYKNLQRMNEDGFEGRYGFYEAIDYTPVRLSRGQTHALIQTFMAHHQGMSFLALDYLLQNRPMQKRFAADVQFQTTLLLLQEQIPKTTGAFKPASDTEEVIASSANPEIRVIHSPDTPVPEVQLLSNGRYHVMLTNSGGGYSRWKETALTRWREDTTMDNWGTFCFIRNIESGEYWSNTYQPTRATPKNYEAIFSQGRVEFRRRDYGIETYTEVIVSPEDDIEVRRIHLTNHTRNTTSFEITSYAEVVLALPAADNAHSAFSNLFVQTSIRQDHQAIACTRRARSRDEQPPWMFHLMKVNGVKTESISYETDRSQFIGRGHSISKPQWLNHSNGLTGAEGSVLDPIVSIQYRFKLEPGEIATIDLLTGIAPTKEINQSLIDKYQDKHLRDRAFELSWTHNQVVLRQIGATEADAQLFGRLAGSILYNNPTLRATPAILAKNRRGQSALWSYSISGDLPIILLQVSDSGNITLVRQLIKAQAYLQLKGLSVDLVILNEDPSGYRQILQDQIQGMIAAGFSVNTSDKQGRIFVRPAEQVSAEDKILLQTVARVIISDSQGTLADQIGKQLTARQIVPLLVPSGEHPRIKTAVLPTVEREFSNGIGGFSKDGKEYVITVTKNQTTPLPWINVIANKTFGTIISESGASYTWAENAHEFRLTPWMNDPVSDGSGEAFYIRDEESGHYWSPMPWPIFGTSPYIVRHGFGYTIFEHTEDGIVTEARVHVDVEACIKFITIKIRNQSGRTRKLSATGYMEWVLGSLRTSSAMHIVTQHDASTGALMARNAYNTEFYNRETFFDVDDTQYHFTTDRSEFIGRNGSLRTPKAMLNTRLSGRTGAGFDPCAAIQVPFDLDHGREKEVIFRLGAGKDVHDANDTNRTFQGSEAARLSFDRVNAQWDGIHDSIRIETPDASINTLTNGWLLYQILSSRLWGRSGFYQSGGAFGFRDQLQDVLALLHVNPQITREQILLSASRQFQEGDVQHWWHPPLGRGVRTLCSDDFLWLPYVVSRYVTTTGDLKILDEQVPFLQGRQLNVHEESYYDLPITTDQRSSVYDHCKRAIQHGLRFGEHGLPLIGSGDWNDGMNLVGIEGKGESSWLGFFLYDILIKFIDIAKKRGDQPFIKSYEQQAALLKQNINKHAWDGDWYMRAFFDDGTPLGSSKNQECKIDSISQSWSVISGAGEKEKSLVAMKSAEKFLVNREKHIIQLLDPPFNNSSLEPGYIKGYVPGVRENGGQYTHAAVWMVMAFAKLKDRGRTAELLRLINPIGHGATPEESQIYKVEPYVMAADVYGVSPHTGRGGWTWYTGSAGWMYQLIIESFLGLKKEGNKIWFEPCVPEDWKSFKMDYRFGRTHYHLEIRLSTTEKSPFILLDGSRIEGPVLELNDDGGEHQVILYDHPIVSSSSEEKLPEKEKSV